MKNNNFVTTDESSFVRAIRRVSNTQIEVVLEDKNSGAWRAYGYKNISNKKYNALLSSASVGQFLNFSIMRNPKHEVKS